MDTVGAFLLGIADWCKRRIHEVLYSVLLGVAFLGVFGLLVTLQISMYFVIIYISAEGALSTMAACYIAFVILVCSSRVLVGRKNWINGFMRVLIVMIMFGGLDALMVSSEFSGFRLHPSFVCGVKSAG